MDGFFISQILGDTGLAAITVGYPISALIGAVGTEIGLSGSIWYTILHAQKKAKEQQECFSGTFWLILLTGVLLSVVLYAFSERILGLMGAQGDVLEL